MVLTAVSIRLSGMHVLMIPVCPTMKKLSAQSKLCQSLWASQGAFNNSGPCAGGPNLARYYLGPPAESRHGHCVIHFRLRPGLPPESGPDFQAVAAESVGMLPGRLCSPWC